MSLSNTGLPPGSGGKGTATASPEGRPYHVTMNHTDIKAKLEKLRNTELAELVASVKAHGGLYRFDCDGPRVRVHVVPDASPLCYRVLQVSVNDDGLVCLTGTEVGALSREVDFPADCVLTGDLSEITGAIQFIGSVEDVTSVGVTDPGEFFLEAADTLESIRRSGYWPFASPCPCSTEVKLRDAVNKAVGSLRFAAELDRSLYGRGGDRNAPPSVKATKLK